MEDSNWPELPLDKWIDTYATLHMWTQIVGKIRLGLAPFENHWWQVTFYITSRGMRTSPIPYGQRTFEIIFDLIQHKLGIETSDGKTRFIPLKTCSVADFYFKIMEALRSLGINVSIWTTPVEVEERIPFEKDNKHSSYDPEYVTKWWRIQFQADRIMKKFRSNFIGKVSPVHFFWGSFDMAVTLFSGRLAPVHPSVPNIAEFVTIEAYSHEVSSCGFWPGAGLGEPAFYSYAYPEPKNYKKHPIKPPEAYYDKNLKEFILPYEAVRKSKNPETMLLDFFQSTYEAAANLAKWDRKNLERRSL